MTTYYVVITTFQFRLRQEKNYGKTNDNFNIIFNIRIEKKFNIRKISFEKWRGILHLYLVETEANVGPTLTIMN